MSTKTLRKRIALVAVTALGAGLLSVVAVPSANAGNTGNDKLHIGATATTTGAGVASSTMATQRAKGWVSKTSTNGTSENGGFSLTGGIAGSAVVLASAAIPFSVGSNATSANGISVVVTGGTLSSLVGEGGAATVGTAEVTTTVNGSATTAVAVQGGTTAANLSGLFTVSAAAGSTATIAAYSGTGITGTTSATNGTLVGIWTLTVASASASGTYSAADSSIFQQAAVAKGTTAGGNAGTSVTAYDVSSRIDNGKVGVIYFDLNDAFTAAITTGTISATATNGATVNVVDAPGSADAYAATTAFDSLTNTDGVGFVVVNQPVVNTAGSTTVTITHNGSVLATKTLNWNGDVASITFDSANSNSAFNNGATEESAYGWSGLVYVAKDAAGNTLNLTTLPTIDSATGALVGASLGATQNTTSGVLQTAAAGYGTATMVVPTSALNGAGTFMLKLSNAAGTSIKSAVINATVSNGSLNSFVASWDKASYAPGEIATLTVTGKDAYGNAIYDGATAAGLALTVAGSATAGFTAVGTACTTSTAFSGGKFTCKYAANTEGAWSYSVDVTTATPQSPSVGALKITAGGATSNADVLKAIVSLIASINKQIAALQKALLRR
jgi:hypothetical protein